MWMILCILKSDIGMYPAPSHSCIIIYYMMQVLLIFYFILLFALLFLPWLDRFGHVGSKFVT